MVRDVSRRQIRRGVKDVDVNAEADPVAEDPKTIGGPIAQDLLPLPRHSVFSVREPRSWCRNPGRMSTRLLSARFSAHADPDSVWTSSPRSSLLSSRSFYPPSTPLCRPFDSLSRSRSISTSRHVSRVAIARKFRRRTRSIRNSN